VSEPAVHDPVALNAPISSGPTWYLDADGDGFGDPNMSQQSDTPPAGYIANNGDCNDSNSTIYPNAPEILNMLDDNCDGIVDNGNFYGDADADGFSVVQGDCNDTDASINPGATEVVGDGIDNNCNGTIDEG
jgi:hypothetical protein